MKWCLMISVIMVLGFSIGSVLTASADEIRATGSIKGTIISSELLGDVNQDGKLNLGDAIYLHNFRQSVPVERGDFNCDGVVEPQDVLLLFNYISDPYNHNLGC